MNSVLIIVSLFWIVRIAAEVITFVHVWFIKEYRPDRMMIHLATPQGRRILWMSWRRPPLTPKSLLLVVMSFVSLSLLYVAMPLFPLVRLAVLDIVTFGIVSVWVLLFSLPTRAYHHLLIGRAIRKLRAHRNLMAVGITGSYGKTSTKEFLAEILSTKYRVMKTEASKNSAIGIAEVVLKELKPDTKWFVVEMGAYTEGEIAEMVRMVRPTIGIVTAVNAQHQDLFHSLERTQRAKYELVAGLPADGVAILNADNDYTREMAAWANRDGKTVWLYTTGKGKMPGGSGRLFSASKIRASLTGSAFELSDGNASATVTTALPGNHQVANVLAAAAAASACGLKLPAIAAACRNLHVPAKTMLTVPGVSGSIFIDDTFNNNPDAARAAIDVLAGTAGRKILVFQPMVELGTYAEVSHETVGAYAAEHCDAVILTNTNHFAAFERGFRSVSPDKALRVLAPRAAEEFIRQEVKAGDHVLFKGKESAFVLARFKHPVP